MNMLRRVRNDFRILGIVEVDSTAGGVSCVMGLVFFEVTKPASFYALEDNLWVRSFTSERDFFPFFVFSIFLCFFFLFIGPV